MENFIVDPLNFFPPEILSNIVTNLNGNDLLTASTLNSSWNFYIVNSKEFKRKIKVKISCYGEELSEEVLKVLMESERKYENLHIECCAFCLDKTHAFLLTQEFKCISVLKTSYIHSMQAVEFFRKIEKSVEEIEMSEVFIKHPYFDGKDKGLHFPKLKTFKTKNIQSFLYHDIFNNLKSLEHFSIGCNDLNMASLNALMKFITFNTKLKVLEISGRIFRQLFLFDLAEKSSFKLKKLVIDDHSFIDDAYYSRVYKNVATFIRKQAATLKEVLIDDYMGDEVLQAVFESPRLKKFSMNGEMLPYLKVDWDGFELLKNPFITNLSIPTNDFRFVKKIFKLLPNLEQLFCSYANEEILKILTENAKCLQSLTIEFLNIENFSKHQLLTKVESLYVRNYISSMLNIPHEWRV